jgi:hypothetical protein
VDEGVIVETKAVEALVPAHKGQVLNYLFLCGLHHGTLLNFRRDRVQHEFVSTRLTPADRRKFTLHQQRWQPLTSRCHELPSLVQRLLSEWGAYLDPALYRDALTHFLGGAERVIHDVDFQSAGTLLGTQRMHLLEIDVAFSVTAVTNHPDALREHQQRLLRHTPLRALQWINFNHNQIEFTTIHRP